MERTLTMIAALTIAGTAGATPAEDMAELVKSWVGQSAEQLVSVWGDGERSETRTRTTSYRYYGKGSRPSISTAGVRAMQGGKTGCSVTFEVDSRGVITDASWSTAGASDRQRARRACWREFRGNQPPG